MLDLDKWTTQVRKGVLELCTLLILRDREMYGYDLVKGLAEIPGLVVTEGTVYPILSPSAGDGGSSSPRLEESPSGPPRKYYSLTAAGRRSADLMMTYWTSLADAVGDLDAGRAGTERKGRRG